MKKIVFVTSNNHKFKEATDILCDFEVIKKPLEITEIQGEIEEICKHKANEAFKEFKAPCFVEDTSLIFQAWGKLPGPYIKYFLNTVGPSGLNKMLLDFKNKKATALATLGYMDKTLKEPLIFQGKVTGEITAPKGTSGFEWDKIFIPKGYKATFAELGMEIKNKISHRKNALLLLKEYLLRG